MGTAISSLLNGEETAVEDLAHRVLAIDAYNMLYQFLTTIRTRDGTPLKNSKGRTTSHMVGLFSRITNFMGHQHKLVFVYDGKTPDLKAAEIQRRKSVKQAAAKQLEKATQEDDVVGMKKYAGRTAVLTKDMVKESQQLLDALGIPWVQAPSEAEAQAAYMVRQEVADYVVSQDMDCLLFGAPKMLRNLSISGKRKRPGTSSYYTINPEIITLEKELSRLDITQTQLIALGMLVGTDFNPKGIKGLGPKKGLKLVKESGEDLEKIFTQAEWDEHQEVSWETVYDVIATMPTTNDYTLKWGRIDREAVTTLLVDEFEFSAERVSSALDKLTVAKQQKGLSEFF